MLRLGLAQSAGKSCAGLNPPIGTDREPHRPGTAGARAYTGLELVEDAKLRL